MRKLVLSAAVAILVAALAVDVVEAGGWRHHHHHGFHGRVFIGVGPAWWWHPYPYWYYGPTYVYSPPPVIVEEPPVYVQGPAAGTAPAPAAGQGYWHYCASARAYYPSVPSCPEPWIRVAPRSE
jgi:hypothetical protein